MSARHANTPSLAWDGGKQPEDKFTLELPLARGRGRPRKPDALTPADRAQRYRDRKKAAKRLAAAYPNGFFRGPNGETWGGRGLTPKWLQVLIQDGKDKEFFRVKA